MAERYCIILQVWRFFLLGIFWILYLSAMLLRWFLRSLCSCVDFKPRYFLGYIDSFLLAYSVSHIYICSAISCILRTYSHTFFIIYILIVLILVSRIVSILTFNCNHYPHRLTLLCVCSHYWQLWAQYNSFPMFSLHIWCSMRLWLGGEQPIMLFIHISVMLL